MAKSSTTQLFLQSPQLGFAPRSITLSSNLTLSHLKLSQTPTLNKSLLDSLYFSFNGRPLPDSTLLSSLPSRSTLLLLLRLRGGGGDGGATGAESRDCYLSMYLSKKPDKVDPNEKRLSKWTTCALSGEPLVHPVVIDRLGNIFNKEPLVESLLKKTLPKAFRHIRGLKDMFPVNLEQIPGAEEYKSETRFQCPISGLEFNGKYPFFALRGCGHVISSKALREVKSSACLVCHKEYSELDKIVINGSEDEVNVLRERMEEERGKVKEKREKKRVGDEKGDVLENGKKESKRFKALDIAPANANKAVYASIFTSSNKGDFKETYSCRSLPLGRN
ncbi:protein RTF2 [Carex littledalei]|uniref:Protein RTF2 n=1 Tax=Carex littledalei TaxID=544730 RepID=A0A833R9U0_9POAL|nr:protein RTF2 [Carex littledalei]